ncbi:MAG: hypothetical protein LBJ47_09850 [Tannerella sp.]|nr:hypothetical protein [Tannerella sp.]
MNKEVIIEINSEDGGLTAEIKFKRPDPTALSAMNKLQKTDEVRAVDMLFTQCCVDCPEWIRDDGFLKLQVGAAALDRMSNQFTVSVKN